MDLDAEGYKGVTNTFSILLSLAFAECWLEQWI